PSSRVLQRIFAQTKALGDDVRADRERRDGRSRAFLSARVSKPAAHTKYSLRMPLAAGRSWHAAMIEFDRGSIRRQIAELYQYRAQCFRPLPCCRTIGCRELGTTQLHTTSLAAANASLVRRLIRARSLRRRTVAISTVTQ